MCNWFTFYSDISDCVYFSEFFEFDYSCSFCESGQVWERYNELYP